ncbi:MAG: nucleotidyltransferase domain-containing protein [Phycisphaerae bacterium]|nr:nucleotidyltransferase domain-containing protein [Phycisphaerae bacterium]
MDTQQAVHIVKQFADVVRSRLPVRKVVLYGSYARGTPHEYSDIDVAVLVERIEGDLLDLEAMLFRLGRGIDFRIEPILREEGHDPSGLTAEILRTGHVVYSAA